MNGVDSGEHKIGKMRLEKKYLSFVAIGVLLMAVLAASYVLLSKFITADLVSYVGVILSILAALLAEKIAQRRAGVNLIWSRLNAAKVARFLAYFLIFSVFLAISASGILQSKSLFEYLTNMAVVYMFSGAFFEIINILKREN